MDDTEIPAPSLQNLINQKSLKWIFVGGKGGVGKTTTSSCLGLRLSRHRSKVLIISTDPAHNLSDSFGQKFTSKPTKVHGIDNLEVMEIDPKIDTLEDQLTQDFQMNDNAMSGISSFLKDLSSSIPGIDEAMSFAELMKQVQNMNYDVIVFDTAPTGHTLRLLSFPSILEKAFDKIMSFKNKFSGPLGSMMSGLMGGDGQNDMQETFLSRLDQTREIIQKVNAQFQDPNATTFVCVCIPEFLSLYETERLVQELSKNGIDVHNIVVNQILYPLKSSQCIQCLTRRKMQQKYINQIYDLYEDFHVVEMPQLNEEVRGIPKLEEFSQYLVQPYYIEENEKEEKQ